MSTKWPILCLQVLTTKYSEYFPRNLLSLFICPFMNSKVSLIHFSSHLHVCVMDHQNVITHSPLKGLCFSFFNLTSPTTYIEAIFHKSVNSWLPSIALLLFQLKIHHTIHFFTWKYITLHNHIKTGPKCASMCTRNCINESLEDFPDDYKFKKQKKTTCFLKCNRRNIQITKLPETIVENEVFWLKYIFTCKHQHHSQI